jgi:hypothetical protein
VGDLPPVVLADRELLDELSGAVEREVRVVDGPEDAVGPDDGVDELV